MTNLGHLISRARFWSFAVDDYKSLSTPPCGVGLGSEGCRWYDGNRSGRYFPIARRNWPTGVMSLHPYLCILTTK